MIYFILGIVLLSLNIWFFTAYSELLEKIMSGQWDYIYLFCSGYFIILVEILYLFCSIPSYFLNLYLFNQYSSSFSSLGLEIKKFNPFNPFSFLLSFKYKGRDIEILNYRSVRGNQAMIIRIKLKNKPKFTDFKSKGDYLSFPINFNDDPTTSEKAKTLLEDLYNQTITFELRGHAFEKKVAIDGKEADKVMLIIAGIVCLLVAAAAYMGYCRGLG